MIIEVKTPKGSVVVNMAYYVDCHTSGDGRHFLVTTKDFHEISESPAQFFKSLAAKPTIQFSAEIAAGGRK